MTNFHFYTVHGRAEVVDFAEPTGPSGTHPLVMEWVSNYYRTGNPSLLHHKCSNAEKENEESTRDKKTSTNSDKPVDDKASTNLPDDVDLPPLYFQHEGKGSPLFNNNRTLSRQVIVEL